MKMGFFFRVMALVVALVVVIYSIRALQSSQIAPQVADPNSIIGMLAGSDQRLLNWCPAEVSKVEIFAVDGESLKVLTTPQDLSAVCELMVGGFAQSGTESPKFSVILKAYSSLGVEHSLEKQVGTEPIFRFKGMPFSSSGLDRALARLRDR